jgi:hypothetical protein
MAAAIVLDDERALLIWAGERAAGITHDVDVAVRVGRNTVGEIITARPGLLRP